MLLSEHMAPTGAVGGADRRFDRSFSTTPKERAGRRPGEGYSNDDSGDSADGRPQIPEHGGAEQQEGKPEHCRDALGDEVGVPLLESIEFPLSISNISVDRELLERLRRVGLQGWRGAMTGRRQSRENVRPWWLSRGLRWGRVNCSRHG